ncbi:MAG: hypothetical protein AABZ06_06705, partial [Bdellovibrionota bacterium]
AKPNKRITYLVGNHDADLFFQKVRERIIKEWDPEAESGSSGGKVTIIADRDHIRLEGGVDVYHGNQFEAMHILNFSKPLLESGLSKPVLNIPWGSFYILKIVNRMKWERDYLDKVRPLKVLLLVGAISDPWFIIRYVFLSIYYFLKTRFVYSPKRRSSFKVTMDIFKQEVAFFMDLERNARKLLDQDPELKTVIIGHTHKPISKGYPDGKQYINTGTWTKMVHLDLRSIGQQSCPTFALIKIRDGHALCDLRYWVGEHSPHRVFSN